VVDTCVRPLDDKFYRLSLGSFEECNRGFLSSVYRISLAHLKNAIAVFSSLLIGFHWVPLLLLFQGILGRGDLQEDESRFSSSLK